MIIWVTEAGAYSMEGKTANCHVVERVARALEMARNWFGRNFVISFSASRRYSPRGRPVISVPVSSMYIYLQSAQG